MTTPLTKLIAENKERPIAEAPREFSDNGFILFDHKDHDAMVVHWENYSGWPWVTGDSMTSHFTHFRPLPDDRLALVCEVLLEEIQRAMSINFTANADGVYGMRKILEDSLKRATAIAEGKE